MTSQMSPSHMEKSETCKWPSWKLEPKWCWYSTAWVIHFPPGCFLFHQHPLSTLRMTLELTLSWIRSSNPRLAFNDLLSRAHQIACVHCCCVYENCRIGILNGECQFWIPIAINTYSWIWTYPRPPCSLPWFSHFVRANGRIHESTYYIT